MPKRCSELENRVIRIFTLCYTSKYLKLTRKDLVPPKINEIRTISEDSRGGYSHPCAEEGPILSQKKTLEFRKYAVVETLSTDEGRKLPIQEDQEDILEENSLYDAKKGGRPQDQVQGQIYK